MSFSTAAEAIKARLKANWTKTAVFYQNEKNTLPSNSAFIFLETMSVEERLVAFSAPGANEYDISGYVNIHVFVPENLTAKYCRDLADLAAAVFRGQRFSSITCYGATILGNEEKSADYGKFWKLTVSVDFVYRFTS